MTAEQKIQSADKLFAWLKKKYPLISVEVSPVYRNTAFLGRKGVTAFIRPIGNKANIEISVGRPANEVLRSVAHEYKHVLQIYKDGIPVDKIGAKQEMNAVGFAAFAMGKYIKEVGTNW